MLPRSTRYRQVTRRMIRVLGFLVLFYACYLLLALWIQRSVVFPRHLVGPVPSKPPDWPGLERLWLETDEGRTEVWFVRAPDQPGASKRPAVLFAHGNAELIDHQHVIVEGCHLLGIHVMLCEYRGYGRSTGTPSQRHLVEDFVRCFEILQGREVVDGKRIVLHGRSIGTGVVCAVAARCSPAAVVLRSPFLSVRDMARAFLIPPFLVLDPFDNVKALRQYGGPVLILHGDRDTVIPVQHGRRLQQLVPGARYIEYAGYGHNDFPEHSERYWKDIAGFLRDVGVLR